jgi:FO synthase
VKLAPEDCVELLAGGVNDLGGTLMEETISRMAGSSNGSMKTIAEIKEMAGLAGRIAIQRDTIYGRVSEERALMAESFDASAPRVIPVSVGFAGS